MGKYKAYSDSKSTSRNFPTPNGRTATTAEEMHSDKRFRGNGEMVFKGVKQKGGGERERQRNTLRGRQR